MAEFATRRLGPQAYQRLVDPFVSGIFAGDPTRISLKAALPRLAELEAEYGSLITASRKLKKQRSKDDHGGAAGPGGRLTSFPGGVSQLIDALGAALGDRVRLGTAVSALTRTANGWTVVAGDLTLADLDAVVLAVPAYAASQLLSGVDSDFKAPLADIPYAPVAVVALGYPRAAVEASLDGFGFLIPSSEERPVLGCLWTSSIFPGHRSPADHVLLRSMVGGARMPELAMKSDDELTTLVREQLQQIMGLDAAPTFVNIARHKAAIPQYETGHLDRLAAVNAALERYPGLHVTGNAFRGVGINDCTREAEALASKLMD